MAECLRNRLGNGREGWGDPVEPNCPNCGIPHEQGDLFCRKCGARLGSTPGGQDRSSPFETELMALLKMLKEFRAWIDHTKRKNVRFMRAYKQKTEEEIGPFIREFEEKYGEKEEGQSPLFCHIMEVFSVFSRPINFMETRLRPSVGMGVFLERWMMTEAVESHLKECCQEVDRHLEELTKKTEVRSQKSGVRMGKEAGEEH